MNAHILRVAAAAFLCAVAAPAAGEPAPFMMQTRLGDRVVEGQPLVWSKSQVLLLGRDGALYDFDPADAKDSKKTGKSYVGYAPAEIQALLRAEFGRRVDLSTTAHFVVVHPRGQGRQWADHLETLYRGFTHYMSVRGFPTREPATPLVAVVFASQDEYFQDSAARGMPLAPGTLGHYDPLSNRVYLYDLTEGDESIDWSANAETIIHEATHQTAFNVGVHTRFAEQPRWLVEGLAMMFEAPGVWNAASLHTQADRINRYRIDHFRAATPNRPADWVAQLAASDQPFDSGVLDAYAAAWTLTFYLCETQPQQYSAYLARVAARQPFAKYLPAERLRDFTAAFGRDLDLLAAQVTRFTAELP